MDARRIHVDARAGDLVARSFYNEHGYYEIWMRERMYGGIADGVRLEKVLCSET